MNTKICKTCKQLKVLDCFYKNKKNKGGYDHDCKECHNLKMQKYLRTIPGLISKIYRNEKVSSKRRKHPAPAYSKAELTVWLYTQGIEILHAAWAASGYESALQPSVDRINSNLPYTLENIQLVTWKENHTAITKEVMTCKFLPKHSRCVQQLDDSGTVLNTFKSIAFAARQVGTHATSIHSVCTGKNQHTKNFH